MAEHVVVITKEEKYILQKLKAFLATLPAFNQKLLSPEGEELRKKAVPLLKRLIEEG